MSGSEFKIGRSRPDLLGNGNAYKQVIERLLSFCRGIIGVAYIFALASWHLRISGYIGGILRLVADYAKTRVLDFGGGMGTHAIAAALCPKVTEVTYADLNTENCNFVRERSQKLG